MDHIRRFINIRTVSWGLVIIGIAVIVAVINVVVAFSSSGTPDGDVQAGVDYIGELEDSDLDAVEEELSVIESNKRKAAFRDSVESGDINVWSMFDDIALMGESRTYGFIEYGFLDESQVFAGYGNTVPSIRSYEDDLVALNPSYIIMQYGSNDLRKGNYKDVYEFLDLYDSYIEEVQELVPNSTIIIQSILDVTDDAYTIDDGYEKLRQIPEWNEAMKEHFTEEGIPYIDMDETVETYGEGNYRKDGLHFNSSFFEPWATRLLMEIIEL